MKFTETYAYACAHHLPTFPEGHKCRRVHGHLCEVTITIEVSNGARGYAFDHADLDGIAKTILGPLDHHMINDVPGLEDGLAETQLAWLVHRWQKHVEPLGATLVECHLDELSSGGTFRAVKHRKSWP